MQGKIQKFLNFLLLSCAFAFLLLTFNLAQALAQEATLSSPTPVQTPNSVRDTLRDKIEERLSQISNKPKALVGKITDIQDGSLLIETKNGVKQLKLAEKPTIIDTRSSVEVKKKKIIEPKNLVLGDIIVAMGWANTKDVLDTRRILIIGELPTTTRRAVYGIVEETGKDSLRLGHPKKEEKWTIKVDSKTRVTAKVDGKVERAKFTDIQKDDRIAVVGTPTKETNTLLARLVHIIPGGASGLLKTASPSPTPKSTQAP